MAKLVREDGTTLTSVADITAALEPISVAVDHWPVGDDPELRALLNEPGLNNDEKEMVLRNLDHYFEKLEASEGYQTRDLIVLHSGVPDLDKLLAKFDRAHTHDDDEVRYIIDGDGVFGFIMPDGKQNQLTVEAGEYINVPAGTEHWFVLTESKRIKAVRYFTSIEGWTPNYTGTEIRVGN